MGYGWQLWMGRVPGLYRFDGGQGQLCFVYPEKNCVIAIHQAGHDPDGVNECIAIVHEFMRNLPEQVPQETPEQAAALQAFLGQRALPAGKNDTGAAVPHWMNGVYHVCEGVVQPWIEVVPFDEDFWHFFYDPGVQSVVTTVELQMTAQEVLLIFNGRTRITARLDGIYTVGVAPNVLPGLDKYSAVAGINPDGTLNIELRWLNGWFTAVFVIAGAESGCITVDITKNMLHDRLEPIRYHAKALRIR